MLSRNNFPRQSVPFIPNHLDEKRERAVRIVLADDHPIVLSGLAILLQPEPEIEIVAAVPDGATALEAIRTPC
jgi:hypothetical protein